jgi:hypothetical protein
MQIGLITRNPQLQSHLVLLSTAQQICVNDRPRTSLSFDIHQINIVTLAVRTITLPNYIVNKCSKMDKVSTGLWSQQHLISPFQPLKFATWQCIAKIGATLAWSVQESLHSLRRWMMRGLVTLGMPHK